MLRTVSAGVISYTGSLCVYVRVYIGKGLIKQGFLARLSSHQDILSVSDGNINRIL